MHTRARRVRGTSRPSRALVQAVLLCSIRNTAMLSVPIINDILLYLRSHNTSISELILAVLRNPQFETHPLTHDLACNTTEIVSALCGNRKTRDALDTWAHTHMKKLYHQAARRVAHKQNGWHFSALRATADQFTEFRIEDMAKDLRDLEPRLWDLVGYLLSGEDMDTEPSEGDGADDAAMNEEDYFAALGELDEMTLLADAAGSSEKVEDKRVQIVKERRRSLRAIVSRPDLGSFACIPHCYIRRGL